jgi:23S rRNA (cytosine1962-C5)-methyltransferase
VTSISQTKTKSVLPCILFEDEDLLVVHKPSKINTHQTSKFDPWGLHELILHARPDLSKLGIHQRLDRDTSGVIVFAKSQKANQSLSSQFEQHTIVKTYRFITTGTTKASEFEVADPIEGKSAHTHFRFIEKLPSGFLWEAKPQTGRTHQIRIHAASRGLQIRGDDSTEPLLLHSFRLELKHPANDSQKTFEADLPKYFRYESIEERTFSMAIRLRELLIDLTETDAYRLLHREADGFSQATIDRLGDWLYIEDFAEKREANHWKEVFLPLTENNTAAKKVFSFVPKGCILSRAIQGERREAKELIFGQLPPVDFSILENGFRFRMDLMAAGGTGLFLDQRENRKHLFSIAKKKRVLNLFAYTCGFSVVAALGGAKEVISVDLSKRSLEWGKQNFSLNGLEIKEHKFWADDVWDVLRKMKSKNEKFDIVIADPPSFSRSKSSGTFSVKKDFKRLIASAAPLVSSEGWILASTNSAEWNRNSFQESLSEGLSLARRKITQEIWGPQPFDFPITSNCPNYLKTIWIKLD